MLRVCNIASVANTFLTRAHCRIIPHSRTPGPPQAHIFKLRHHIYEDDTKNEDGPKNEEDPKNKVDPKNENDPKNEDNPKNED